MRAHMGFFLYTHPIDMPLTWISGGDITTVLWKKPFTPIKPNGPRNGKERIRCPEDGRSVIWIPMEGYDGFELWIWAIWLILSSLSF